MGKITKEQTKLHEQACDLIHGTDRVLTGDEVESCLTNYNPLAENNVGKGAIYFTPLLMALDLMALATGDHGHFVDLCAGIGRLSWALMQRRYWEARQIHITAIELNSEFVRVGKRLLPMVDWINGSALDLNLLRGLGHVDEVVCNPPFGNIPSKEDGKWLSFQGPADLMFVEVALRIAERGGAFILPQMSVDFKYSNLSGRGQVVTHHYLEDGELPKTVAKFKKLWPEVRFGCVSVDAADYQDQWVGASPNVEMVSLSYGDTNDNLPLGLPEEKQPAPVKPIKKVKPIQDVTPAQIPLC